MITSSEFRAQLASKIHRLFKNSKLTRPEMCDVMGVTRHTWDATIRCEREVKAIELYRLSQHFKCDVSYFYPWAN